MRETEARHAKDWELKRALTSINKARRGAKTHPNGLTRLTLEMLEGDERVIRTEMQARKLRKADCDCQCPEPKSGAALVSEDCPIHAGDFVVVTTVL